MANIAAKVAAIREAIFGKDVRESIASGIEAINDEVVSTTARQNVIDSQEQTRIDNENIRKAQEITRQSQETNRINTFNTNESNRTITFNTNESNRQILFSTNETDRNATMTEFKNWYTTATSTGSLPNIVDGGNIRDPRDGHTYDGGDLGDRG